MRDKNAPMWTNEFGYTRQTAHAHKPKPTIIVHILNLQLPAQPNYVYLFSAIDARLVEAIITKGIQ